jgi:hypothetical protein
MELTAAKWERRLEKGSAQYPAQPAAMPENGANSLLERFVELR